MNSRTWKTSFAGSRATDHECFCFLHSPEHDRGNSSSKGTTTVPGIIFPPDQCLPEPDLRSSAGKSRTPYALFDPNIYYCRVRREPAVLSAGFVDQICPGYLFILSEPLVSFNLCWQPFGHFSKFYH